MLEKMGRYWQAPGGVARSARTRLLLSTTVALAFCLFGIRLPSVALTEGPLREWIDRATIGATGEAVDARSLPFRFEYGGRSSDELLGAWKRELKTMQTSLGEQRVVTWDDPQTGLRVEWTVLLYDGYDAAEMRLAFEHRGKGWAEVLRQVRVLRQRIGAVPVDVIYATGGLGQWLLDPELRKRVPPNFEPAVSRLAAPGDKLKLYTLDGWSSNWHLPFWLTMSPGGEGFYYGLGWTGQWSATFRVRVDSVLAIEAGMEHLNLALEPGERISQPSVLVGHFTGGRWAGHNALRRILYERYAPLLDGRKPLPPVSWNHFCAFGGGIDEKLMLEQVDAMAPLGIEYFCVDAGWYAPPEFWQCGNWTVFAAKFPRGLEPLAEAIRAKGMAMGLWFDPERVTEAAYDAFEHKELLVPAREGGQPNEEFGIKVWLVDLSRSDAREWMVNMLGDYIRRLNLEWIRWDLNYPPLEMWLSADEDKPERLGMKEIRYIEGLYEVMDTLRERYPKLVIEGCAGGGRRIDLETIRRSATFWKSDLWGPSDVTRAQLTGANLFLPGNFPNSNVLCSDPPYAYYSEFGGPLGFTGDFRILAREKRSQATEMIRRFKELRRFLVEDYYPLFDYTTDLQKWGGWQFHDPKTSEGFFLVFRPAASPDHETLVTLNGIDTALKYALNADPGSNPPGRACGLPRVASGEVLREGFPVRLETPLSALLVRYRPTPG